MPDATVVVGLLLVLGPVIGLLPVAHPALIPVWSASRERHVAIVAGHRRAWWALNAGFGLATFATAGALIALPGIAADPGTVAGLQASGIVYTGAGVLWCAVLAMRGHVTPLLGDLVAAGAATEPAERLLGAAQRGLFAAFVLGTGLALISLGAALFAGGIVAGPVAAVQVLVGIGVIAWLLRTGDVIPAVLYVPTILLGVALLARI
jgi:hypothetical protein